MAGGITCMFTGDWAPAFFAQVSNATNSIYSNLYLAFPTVTPAIAFLTPTKPSQAFWLAGTSQQACNRNLALVTDDGNVTEFGAQIILNKAGRAAVTVLSDNLADPNDEGQLFWSSVTEHFYATSTLEPLNLWVPNAGGYYACTDGLGDIGVYYRLNTTTTPLGCQDILLEIEVWHGQ